MSIANIKRYAMRNIKLNSMTTEELKEQLQEDILSILEGFGIDEAMEGADYNRLVSSLCDAVVHNVNKLNI